MIDEELKQKIAETHSARKKHRAHRGLFLPVVIGIPLLVLLISTIGGQQAMMYAVYLLPFLVFLLMLVNIFISNRLHKNYLNLASEACDIAREKEIFGLVDFIFDGDFDD